MRMIKIITKIKKGKWKAIHPDGVETYHKTKKEAQTYEHTLLTFGPFPVEYKHE